MAASRPRLTPADIAKIECFDLYPAKKTEDGKHYLHDESKHPIQEKAIENRPAPTFYVFYNCKDATGQPLPPLVVPVAASNNSIYFFSEDKKSSDETIAHIKKMFEKDKKMSKGFERANTVSGYEKLELVPKSKKDEEMSITYHHRFRVFPDQFQALENASISKQEMQNRLAAARNRVALALTAEEKERALSKQQQVTRSSSSSSLGKFGGVTFTRNVSVETYQQPQRVDRRSSVTAADCLAASEELESALGIVRAEGRRGVLAACNDLQEGGAARLADAKSGAVVSGRSSNRGVFSNTTPAAQPAVPENAQVYYIDVEMTDLRQCPAPRALQPMRTPVNR